jgi:hypothetical protein
VTAQPDSNATESAHPGLHGFERWTAGHGRCRTVEDRVGVKWSGVGLVVGVHGVTLAKKITTACAVQDRRPTLPHVWLASDGERPVLANVRDALIPQLASTDKQCPESASWFNLKSQGCWFESSSGYRNEPFTICDHEI